MNKLLKIMSNNLLNLKRRVMVRVYFEYTKGVLVNHPDYFMLGLFTVVSFFFVSIQDVLNNVPKDDIGSAFNFFVIAVRDTSRVLQILIVGFLVRLAVGGFLFVRRNIDKLPLARLRY